MLARGQHCVCISYACRCNRREYSVRYRAFHESLRLAGDIVVFFSETTSTSPSPTRTNMALIKPADKHRINTAGTHHSVFYFSSTENMLFLSSFRVAREVEKQACLPTDGQKEIFIWSPRRGDSETYASTRFLPPPTPGSSHAGGDIISLSAVTFLFFFFFCRGSS